MSVQKKAQVTQVLEVQVVNKMDKYLGMPSVIGRSKKEIFSVIGERVWKRINGWGEKMLSKAGKEVLIKSVLQAIPTYIMSCFSLPKYLINSIEAAIRAFWWGNGEKQKMAWIAWDQLCKSKRLGGMGFRDLHSFNLALLGKQCWRIITKPESLMARILQARYFPYGSFMDATAGARPSSSWTSILKARALMKMGLRVRIGNGYSTDPWNDPWIPEDGRFTLYTPGSPTTFFPRKVADLIDPETNSWNK